MTTKNITTTDLSEFGFRELKELRKILEAWEENGLPEDFYSDEVTPMFNKNSGEVFLANSEYQACMALDGKLESFYSCPNCGHEGFEDECKLMDDGCNECKGE